MIPPRHKSFNDPGHAHFLTFSCYRHCQLFTEEDACRLLAESIGRAREIHEFDLWAYVFMPDHVHLLIRPRCEIYDVAQILKSIKGPFAKRLLADWRVQYPERLKFLEVRTSSGLICRVWQRGGGFDRNLYSHDLIRGAIKYIEWNPVRAGYVSNPAEWKWSSASSRLDTRSVPLQVDKINW